MPNHIAFFAVHADDVDRARSFYASVFSWSFEPWGPPGFFLIQTGSGEEHAIRGSLQQRQEPLSGTGMRGYECTIGVDAVDETAAAVEANGGRIKLGRTTIPGVGHLIQFVDTEGNEVSAMQYDAGGR